MKAEDTISALQRLREEGNIWKSVVEKGKEMERNEESLLLCDYFMQPSIDRERRSLDEKRVKWIVRRVEMVTKETKERFLGIKEVEYRVDKQAVEKRPATESPNDIEWQLLEEQWLMEMLLLYEVNQWERLFWNKLKAILDQIENDRVEVKGRLTREWRADCWRRLNIQMHAAQKRLTDDKGYVGLLSDQWASSISRFFEGAENPNSISLRREIESQIDEHELLYPRHASEIRLRIEYEMEDRSISV